MNAQWALNNKTHTHKPQIEEVLNVLICHCSFALTPFRLILVCLILHHKVQQLTQHFLTRVEMQLNQALHWLNVNSPPRRSVSFTFAGPPTYITEIRGATLPQRASTIPGWVVITAPAAVKLQRHWTVDRLGRKEGQILPKWWRERMWRGHRPEKKVCRGQMCDVVLRYCKNKESFQWPALNCVLGCRHEGC